MQPGNSFKMRDLMRWFVDNDKKQHHHQGGMGTVLSLRQR